MRKPNNTRTSGNKKSFKTKDANKAFKSKSMPNKFNREEASDKREKPLRKTKPRKAFDNTKPKRDFGNAEERKPYKKTFFNEKTSDAKEKPSKNTHSARERKPYGPSVDADKSHYSEERKPFNKNVGKDKYATDSDKKPRRKFENSDARKPFDKNFDSHARKFAGTKKFEKEPLLPKKRFSKRDELADESIKRVKFDEFENGKVFSNSAKTEPTKPRNTFKKSATYKKSFNDDGLIRLNKYLSNAGIASRREADTLIQSGVVKVNGLVVDKLGTKINPNDKVTYGDSAVKSERKVYLLLNKPKDYITTVDDPQERKTVMELISKACRERVYPVGRLDRNTTGLLLFTNDGELTTKLTHPKFGVKKVYHVSLNKGLKPNDFKAIVDGVELEDGLVKADDLAFIGEGKKEIGIEIHSGRNRIVRRLFEQLGYDVIKLDRVVFAGLTKKDLPRGKHRFLTGKEISFLQMIG
jgi:23S rRNA pseudouridine2605 synthase